MYRLGIWLLALALAFNGVLMNAWNGEMLAAPAIAQSQQADTGGIACDALGNEAAAVAPRSGQTHDHMHNHLKCCGMCNVASVIPALAPIPVAFSYRSAVFHTAQPHLVGHLVALDPDIPKSIV